MEIRNWLILKMEYKWRSYRFFRRMLNYMIKKGMRYSSTLVCLVNRIDDNQLADLMELKSKYERDTGVRIEYYNRYQI